MARRAFYSFHYDLDSWRASKVRNIGKIEGNAPASDNDWEKVKRGGDAAIQRWIDTQLSGKSVAIVLIGSGTAGRKWIKYEIKKAWEDGKGLLGIYIHNITDVLGNQATKGDNPFNDFKINGTSLSSIIKAHDPGFSTSTYVYDHIKNNLMDWIEEAIEIRKKYD